MGIWHKYLKRKQKALDSSYLVMISGSSLPCRIFQTKEEAEAFVKQYPNLHFDVMPRNQWSYNGNQPEEDEKRNSVA